MLASSCRFLGTNFFHEPESNVKKLQESDGSFLIIVDVPILFIYLFFKFDRAHDFVSLFDVILISFL